MDDILQHPLTASLLLAMAISLCLSLIPSWSNLAYLPLSVLTSGLFLIYPFVLTILNLVFCLRKTQKALSALLLEAVQRLAIRENDCDPQHNFFIAWPI